MFLNIGFSYQWWNKNYGFRFGERHYRDIEAKLNTQAAMDDKLRSRFSWHENLASSQGGVISSPTIGVEPFGHRFIPALFGCQVRYGDAHTPWAENHPLSPEEIDDIPMLTMDDFAKDEHVQVVMEQAELVKNRFGKAGTQQNLGSVANTAIYLRPMELFTDYYDRPKMVHKLFELITNRMKLAYSYFETKENEPACVGVGNCSVCMISPKIYEKFNRLYDLEMMELARSYGAQFSLHQDSDVTPYIDSYRAFDYLHSFDIGFDTDVKAFRAAFPKCKLNIFLYTSFLADRTRQEIVRDVQTLMADAGDPYLAGFSCYDIDAHVGDDKVTALYEAVAEAM